MRVADLLEAEGRVLRKVASTLGRSVALMLVAGVLLLVGSVGLLAGCWLGIDAQLGPAWASAITGAITLALAGGLLWLAGRLNR